MKKRSIDLLNVQDAGADYKKAVPKPVSIPRERRPDWLKVQLPSSENYFELRALMRNQGLHTVCEEANCPNISECWSHRTATFLMLGNICTRACGFCDVPSGRPLPLDYDEPRQVVEAVKVMGLRHVVITSVNRDDIPDGGASIFADVVTRLHREMHGCRVEVLIPDFVGNWDALKSVLEAKPEILNHNVETVSRLYPRVRHKARYARSLELLKLAKDLGSDYGVVTKTGIMVGLGENFEELLELFSDLRSVDCDVLTIGQYLRPTINHLPMERYYRPEEFSRLKEEALKQGFKFVESGPLVRSSYHAHEQKINTQDKQQD